MPIWVWKYFKYYELLGTSTVCRAAPATRVQIRIKGSLFLNLLLDYKLVQITLVIYRQRDAKDRFHFLK